MSGIQAYQIVHWKTWRIRKTLTDKRRSMQYIKDNPNTPMGNLLMQTLPDEITTLENELKQRRK